VDQFLPESFGYRWIAAGVSDVADKIFQIVAGAQTENYFEVPAHVGISFISCSADLPLFDRLRRLILPITHFEVGRFTQACPAALHPIRYPID